MREASEEERDPRTDPDSGIGETAPAPGERSALGHEAQDEQLQVLREELAAAQGQVQTATQLFRSTRREFEQTRSGLTSGLLLLRDQLVRVESSRAWRYGHGVARALSRVAGRRPRTQGGMAAAIGQIDRLLELLGAGRGGSAYSELSYGARWQPPSVETRVMERELGELVRSRLGPVPVDGELPEVTVVIVSRSHALISEALTQLAETDYPQLKVLVVDNGSPNGEVTDAASERSDLSIEVRRLQSTGSYARANNWAAQGAGADLLLFLNDDVRAVEAGWLRELVDARRPEEDEIVGASLVAPLAAETPSQTGSRHVLEQRGITLSLQDGAFAPVRRDQGEDVLGESFGAEVPALAVSGACMLISAKLFGELGGFDEGYQYGLEDIDLCLRARRSGYKVKCSGRSIVVHEGAASQRDAGREFRRINYEWNRRRFHRLWAPELFRDRLSGLVRGDRLWGEGLHLGIIRTCNDPSAGWGDYYTAMELGEAAAELGWRVTYVPHREDPQPQPPPDLDLAVVLLDRFDPSTLPPTTIACAWIRNWTDRWVGQPWLQRYDILLASSERSRQLLIEATGRDIELFPLATNPQRFRPAPTPSEPPYDWVFTGNRWGQRRAIEQALCNRRADRGAIFGKGWEDVGELRRLARGPLEYEQLPAAYAEAKLVLDDTAEPTLQYDAVNARVFDALACGTPVLTNCAQGVSELFDHEFPTWSTDEDLAGQLDALLADPARRAELGTRYREVVLARHTYERRVRALRDVIMRHNARPSFCLKVGAPDWEQAERWGDLHFARGLARALKRLGHRCRIEVLSEWDSLAGSTFDVTVHLRGRSDYDAAPGQFNVLWLISHPEELRDETAESYDLVCVASAPFADRLARRVSVPVEVLEQATDPAIFFPDPDPALAHELVFVGNSRGVQRKIIDDLLPTTHDLAIWGGGWQATPAARHLVADHVPNEQLRRIYSSARIVLCDHWPDMRAAGFRGNRLYDALACGALVVSDEVAGLDTSLGDAVLTYSDRDELRSLISRLLGDPQERTRRTADARARILAGETFDDRARALVDWVERYR